MNSAFKPRVRLWPIGVLIVAGAAALLAALPAVLRRPATARAAHPVAEGVAEGVVCFGTVDLESGVTSLLPLQAGRVADVVVRENEAVAKGAVLVRLDDAAARSRFAEAEAALDLARLRLRQARKLPDQHRKQIDRQQAALEAMRQRLAAARQVLTQRQKMAQPAYVAAVDVAASEVQVREYEALEHVEAQRLAELQAQDVDTELQRAKYELAAAWARRTQARLALEECQLKAPRAGKVLRVLVSPGDVLAAERGQPAVLFAPDGPQVIRATVEQEFAPRVKERAPVVVQDEADTSVSWRGRVERIAGWYSQRRAVLHDPSEMSDVRTLECVIVLDPGQATLRLGQSVRVFIGGGRP